ncbi:MAG TPA: matrixin family metalloprotease [Polyangiaceae bacterium]|nr:matrixin family metalloprotease [Polyangiaceae bacterium]
MRFAFASAAAVLVLLARPGSANAFCRTTTSKAPAGWNPAVSGCWTDGVPLAWPGKRVPYGVASQASKQVTLAEATRVADLAFASWNGAQCGGEPLGLEAYDDGPSTVPDGSDGDALAEWAYCADSNSCAPVAHDVVVFDDVAWPYDDPVNTLALTTVTYGVDDGQIFEAYTEVNSAEHALTTTEPPPPDGATYDLQAILTHEAGHFLGLAHATDTTSIMYAYYTPGAITLTADDLDAVCAVYPPASTKGCACGMAGGEARGGAGGAVIGGGSFVVVALGVLRKRRRRRGGPGRAPAAPWR